MKIAVSQSAPCRHDWAVHENKHVICTASGAMLHVKFRFDHLIGVSDDGRVRLTACLANRHHDLLEAGSPPPPARPEDHYYYSVPSHYNIKRYISGEARAAIPRLLPCYHRSRLEAMSPSPASLAPTTLIGHSFPNPSFLKCSTHNPMS